MAKTTKKKPAPPGSKSSKTLSDYKSRETEGKGTQADSKFQKAMGKAKETLGKG